MKTITNQEFAEKTPYKYQTVRRWSRDLFGIDPAAGQSSGVAREYTLEKAFMLYFAAHLISQRKVSIPATKIIIEKIEPWLEFRKYLPFDDWRSSHVNTAMVDGQHRAISHWSLRFLFYDSGEMCITAIGEAEPISKKDFEPVGEFEGDPIKKEYHVYKEIITGCEGLLVNSIDVGVGLVIKDFEEEFGLRL